jgi:DNA-binding transcriptional regulator/RsmH inhibitor MraZ
MYPQPEWEAMTAELRYDPIAETGYSGYLRRLYAASQEISWDSQGRILLLPQLRQHAGLESNVVFVGVNNVVEVHSDQSFGVQAAPLNSDEWEAMRRTVAGQQQARALLQGPELGAP